MFLYFVVMSVLLSRRIDIGVPLICHVRGPKWDLHVAVIGLPPLIKFYTHSLCPFHPLFIFLIFGFLPADFLLPHR